MTMTKRESELEELVKSAYRHTVSELGLESVKPSLTREYEKLQKAHDAIHEFIFLAPKIWPSQSNWHSKSAFFLYHYEAFNLAHRSLIEALCAYYNAASILLRATVELLIEGALFECLSHKEFREGSQVLDESESGRRIKKWLNAIFKEAPYTEEAFERISASIYDKVGPIIEEPGFRPRVKDAIRQLDQWHMLDPIPTPLKSIYEEIYSPLSADVHVRPSSTDVGRRILNPSAQLFEQEVLPGPLSRFAHCLHRVMDFAIVIELNVMKDLIEKHRETQTNLRERMDALKQLELEYS